MSPTKSFNIGDLVFAKVVGYPAWPAKITNLNNKKYDVVFYGTNGTASLKVANLYNFAENKDKFVNNKTMSRANFRQGIFDIENILKAKNQPSKIDESSNSKADKTAECPNNDEEKSTIKNIISNAVDNAKKTSTIETEVSTASTGEEVTVENTKQSLEKTKPLRSGPCLIKNNLLLVYLPTAKCLGIKLLYKKPETFPSVAAEEAWIRKSREEANDIKWKLESGQLEATIFLDRIVDEPLRDGIPKEDAIRFIDELTNEVEPLTMEPEFIGLVQQIRESLGMRRANVGNCLIVLDKIKTINFSKLMLLRNPQCVDVIRRLQRYKGNLEEWRMSSIDEIEFNKHAEKIRNVGAEIYKTFNMLFAGPVLPPRYFFWVDFCERVKVYRSFAEEKGISLK